MKGPSEPSKWKVAVNISILKCWMDLENGSMGGSGEQPVWKKGVKNEARKAFWTMLGEGT